jgi:hypothetical protein
MGKPALPSWLSFTAGVFQGTPPDKGVYTIVIKGTDVVGDSITTQFDINVDYNTAPLIAENP